jgi:hypothetical protein
MMKWGEMIFFGPARNSLGRGKLAVQVEMDNRNLFPRPIPTPSLPRVKMKIFEPILGNENQCWISGQRVEVEYQH